MRPFFSLCSLLLFVLILSNAPARAQSSARPDATAVFRALHLVGQNATVTRSRARTPIASQVSTASNARTAMGTGTASNALTASDLRFSFVGFTAAQKSVLQNYVNANYARMTAVYGQPAPEQRGKTVEVRFEKGSQDFEPPLPGSDKGGTIFFGYNDLLSNAVNLYNFTRVALISFQGPRIPSYDFRNTRFVEAWVFGMSDAAALQVAFLAAGSPANFDPFALGGYALPYYDFLNRPELGNAYIFPRGGNDLVVSDFRMVMAQAAFLKVAVENPNFYAAFNAKLYARGAAGDSVAPAELESLAASVVPTVEGQSFSDWVRRQYALDTRVTTGQKLYQVIVPVANALERDVRSGFVGRVQAFTTAANGDETASTGYGSLAAFDQNGRDVSAFSQELRANNVLSFNDASAPGQAVFNAAFSGLAAPDRALITLVARLGETQSVAYFPFGVAGQLGGAPSYFGATLGAKSGTLQISGSANESVPIVGGTWMATKSYPSGPRVQTQFAANGVTVRRNTAWLVPGAATVVRSVSFLLDVPATSQTFSFSTPAGASRLRMISLPFSPLQTDEARALNKTPESLALARYRPRLSPISQSNGTLVFGIGGDRYELYPRISMPFAPGRGYWLGVETSGYATRIAGSEPPRDRPYEVPLEGGWNQIGVPFNRAWSAQAIQVRYGGFAPVALSVAQTRGYIAPGIWRWRPEGGYVRADTAGAQLNPFEGFFVFAGAARGVSLVFDPNAPALASSALTTAGGWSVPLHATSGPESDIAGRFGISSAPNIAKPPTATRIVTLRFEGADANNASETGSGLAEAYLPQMDENARWTAIVEGAEKGARVTLDWGDLRGLPASVRLTLTDIAGGQSVVMARGKTYEFTFDGTPRRFSIAATNATQTPRLAPKLTPAAPSTNDVLTATPNGDAGLNYAYRWFNGERVLAGETGATLDLRKPGNGDRGERVKVEITARDGNGASATAMAQVTVANSAPFVADGTLRAQTEQTVSVALASADADGDTLLIQRASGPFHGNGSVRLENGIWTLFYTGYKGYSGPDEVQVIAFDGHGARSQTATIRVTVWPTLPANGAPSAFDVSVDTAAYQSASAVLRGFDPNGDALTFHLVRGTRYGSCTLALDPTDGQWHFVTRNIVKPPQGEDRAQFVAMDTQGRTSAPATIILRFHNRPPSAQSGDLSAVSGVETSIILSGADPDNDVLSFRRSGGPREGVGDIRRDADGAWKLFYRSRAGWTGRDEVKFVAQDEAGRTSAPATIAIEVTGASGLSAGGAASSGSS